MAKTKANESLNTPSNRKKAAVRSKNGKKKTGEPKTVAEAKKLEEEVGYWHLTDDEGLLRSPSPEDEYKTSDSWRVFRIMGEFVNGFDHLGTITRGVSIFGSARTDEK